MSYYGKSRELICNNDGLMREVVDNFLMAKPKKTVWGNFRIEGDRLVYRTETMKEIDTQHTNAANEALEGLKKGTVSWHSKNSEKFSDLVRQRIKNAIKEKNYRAFYVSETEVEVIAIKLKRDGELIAIGNSNVLPSIGRSVSYGNVTNNNAQTIIQRELERRVAMLPFSVFEQAKLDISKLNIIQAAEPETVQRKIPNPGYRKWQEKPGPEFIEVRAHFSGASLFEVEGKYFLFDIDRREIRHKIFNPFLVQLTKKVSSIAEAYESLKPKAVLDAEKNGVEVKRQGEWFFIKTDKNPVVKLSEQEKMWSMTSLWHTDKEFFNKAFGVEFVASVLKKAEAVRAKLPKQLALKAGDNRPNTVETGITIGKVTYVTGTVKHEGREHADLRLKGWYIAVPNTSIGSFTITGDVD